MSLFKKKHKLRALDNFAFVGPSGNMPKPVSDNDVSKSFSAPYAGKAWKIRKGTQTYIIQQYLNPNKKGLWEIVNMDNMSRLMENAKLSDIKKYVFDNFGVKLIDNNTTKISDMDYSTVLANWGFAYNGKGPGKIEYWKFRENDDKEYKRAIDNIRSVMPNLILSSSNDGNRRITIMRDELVQSASKEALGKNIATEIKAGKDPKQAAAIAYSVQKENLKDASGFVLCKTDTDYRGVKSKRYVAYYTDYYKTYSTENPNDAALFSNMETAKSWQKHLQRETNWDIVSSSIGKPIKSKKLGDNNVKDADKPRLFQMGSRYCIVAYDEYKQYGNNTFIEQAYDKLEQAQYARDSLQRNDKIKYIIIHNGKVIDRNTVKDTREYAVEFTYESDSGRKTIETLRIRNVNSEQQALQKAEKYARAHYTNPWHFKIAPKAYMNSDIVDKNTIKDDLGYKPDICGCMDFTDIENIVHTTIRYIKAKYPNEENTMEKWLSLIGEEFGELCQAINDGEVNNVIEEGTQTIAAIYLMLSDFIINANVLASSIKE